MKGLAVVNNETSAPAYGVLAIYSCPISLAKAVEWALQGEFEHFHIDWQESASAAAGLNTHVSWSGRAGTASRLASSLIQIPQLKFELTEHSPAVGINERYAFTPKLGLFRADTDAAGNSMFSEDRIANIILSAGVDVVRLNSELNQMLGRAWDSELDEFRQRQSVESASWIRAV